MAISSKFCLIVFGFLPNAVTAAYLVQVEALRTCHYPLTMKRGAEKQLTKDDRDDEVDESSSGEGFRKAPDAVLATRTIKALPGRVGKAAPPKPLFSGFGAPPATNPFVSTTNSAEMPSPTAGGIFSSSGSTFGASTPSAPTTSSFSFMPPSTTSGLGASNNSPTSSNTSKAFASILGSSSSPFAPPPQNAAPLATNGKAQTDLTNYYKNLRGLNTSFLTTVSSTIDNDPFSDLSSLLESYKALRLKVQNEHDQVSEKKAPEIKVEETTASKPPAPPTGSAFSVFGKPSAATQDPKPTSSIPSFAAFGSKDAPTSTSGSATPPANSSLFSNSSAQPSSTAPSSSPFTFGTPASKIPVAVEKPSGFTFGAPSTAGSSKPSAFGSSTTSSSPFSFGPPAGATSTSNPFGVSSTGPFGSSASSPSLPFKIEAGKSPFGSASSQSDKKHTPSVAFGSPSSVAKSSGVFFGFGSTPASTNTSASTTPAPALTSESQETTTTEGGDEGGPIGDESQPKEGTPGLLTPNPHDEEGAGEENEETTHAVKLKAYRMKKADEQGGTGWAELGMGIFRLKKHKETDARRVLLRNSTNGKVNINFKIYSGLKPSIAKKALTFIGHADGVSQTYCVRLPNENQANELKEALDREIEFVKAKDS